MSKKQLKQSLIALLEMLSHAIKPIGKIFHDNSLNRNRRVQIQANVMEKYSTDYLIRDCFRREIKIVLSRCASRPTNIENFITEEKESKFLQTCADPHPTYHFGLTSLIQPLGKLAELKSFKQEYVEETVLLNGTSSWQALLPKEEDSKFIELLNYQATTSPDVSDEEDHLTPVDGLIQIINGYERTENEETVKDETPTIEYEAIVENWMEEKKFELMKSKLEDVGSVDCFTQCQVREAGPESSSDTVDSQCKEIPENPTGRRTTLRRAEDSMSIGQDATKLKMARRSSRKRKSSRVLIRNQLENCCSNPHNLKDNNAMGVRSSRRRSHRKTLTDEQQSKSGKRTKYFCSMCQKDLKNEDSYEAHLKNRHHVTHSCSICGNKYSTKSMFLKHFRMHQVEDTRFMTPLRKLELAKLGKVFSNSRKCFYCDTCNSHYRSRLLLIQHEQVHERDRPFPCLLCDYGYDSESSLKQHMKLHENNKVYPCIKCGIKFPTKKILTYHNKRLHRPSKRHSCEFCSQSYASWKSFNSHLQNHARGRLFPCTDCEKVLLSKHKYDAHIKEHHTAERFYTCDNCNEIFMSKDLLREHMVVHETKTSFKCEVCPRSFRFEMALKKHAKFHKGRGLTFFHSCNMSFLGKSHTLQHERSHTAQNLILCKVCGKKFTNQCRLDSHSNTAHLSDEGTFSCDVCEDVFRLKGELMFHQKKHPNMKSHCELCGKDFDLKSDLMKHLTAAHTLFS